jgi:cell division protein FtsL
LILLRFKGKGVPKGSAKGVNKLLSVIWVTVICSALSVVYVSHLCRQLYNELSRLEQDANTLQVEWGRYLLEQSSWASLSRIEHLAKSRVHMRVAGAVEIVVLRQ